MEKPVTSDSTNGERPVITSEDFTTLQSLIESGNLEAVLRHINDKHIIHTTYRRHFRKQTFQNIPSPVSMAAKCNQGIIMRELISRRFSPIEISHGFHPRSCCAAHFASYMGHLDIVKTLIEEYDVDFTTPDFDNNTPLSLALSSRKLDVAEYLTGKGAGFESIEDLSSALQISVGARHAKLTQRLISLGDSYKTERSSILHDAASTDNIDVVAAILDSGSDVNSVTESERETPFLAAVKYGQLSVMQLLYAKGADPDLNDNYGDTALHIATTSTRNDIVRYLVVDLNVALDKKNRDGETPFYVAVRKKDIPLIQLFLDAGSRPEHEPWQLDTDEEVLHILKGVCSNPRTLRELGCFKVRHMLGRRLPEVDCLPLPNVLKSFVKLTHIS